MRKMIQNQLRQYQTAPHTLTMGRNIRFKFDCSSIFVTVNYTAVNNYKW